MTLSLLGMLLLNTYMMIFSNLLLILF